MSLSIHPTAVVDRTAEIGDGVEIGPYAIVEGDTRIGPGTTIAAKAVVKKFTVLGSGNVVAEQAVLGGDPQDLKFEGTHSRVVIGDGNVIRENVTVHRATGDNSETRIGSGCYLMVGAHVAHDCRLDDGVIIANNAALAGFVKVGDRAFLSGGVVVHQFCQIGRLSMTGGNAKVEKDVLPFTLVDGVPARTRIINVVGLRRAGVSDLEIRLLKQALRALLRRDLNPEKRQAFLEKLGDSEAIRHLREFLGSSTRGYCRGS